MNTTTEDEIESLRLSLKEAEASRHDIIEECARLLEQEGHPFSASMVRSLHGTIPTKIIKSDCQNEDPVAILREALKQASNYIDATPLMPGYSYKEVKAVIRAALECSDGDGAA